MKSVLYTLPFSLAILGVLAYPYISAQWTTIHLAEISKFRQNIQSFLETTDLVPTLSRAEVCDQFYWVESSLPDLVPIIPPSEKAFLVRFCGNTSFRLNGTDPNGIAVGVLGVSPLNGETANSHDSMDLLSYSPTNGAYSPGDLIFVFREEMVEGISRIKVKPRR